MSTTKKKARKAGTLTPPTKQQVRLPKNMDEEIGNSFIFAIKVSNIRCRSVQPYGDTFIRFLWDNQKFRTNIHGCSVDPIWPDVVSFTWKLPREDDRMSREQVLKKLSKHYFQAHLMQEDRDGQFYEVGFVVLNLAVIATGPVHHDLPLRRRDTFGNSTYTGARIIFGVRMAQKVSVVLALARLSLDFRNVAETPEKPKDDDDPQVKIRSQQFSSEYQVKVRINGDNLPKSGDVSCWCKHTEDPAWDAIPPELSLTQLKELCEGGASIEELLIEKCLPHVTIDTYVTQLFTWSLFFRVFRRNQLKDVISMGDSWVTLGKFYSHGAMDERFVYTELEESLWADGHQCGRMKISAVLQNNPILQQLHAGVNTGNSDRFSWISPMVLKTQIDSNPHKEVWDAKVDIQNAHQIFESYLDRPLVSAKVGTGITAMVARIAEEGQLLSQKWGSTSSRRRQVSLLPKDMLLLAHYQFSYLQDLQSSEGYPKQLKPMSPRGSPSNRRRPAKGSPRTNSVEGGTGSLWEASSPPMPSSPTGASHESGRLSHPHDRLEYGMSIMLDLLKKTQKTSMTSFMYKCEEDLLQAQGILLNLASTAMEAYRALTSFDDQRLFANMLVAILNRGELDALGLVHSEPKISDATADLPLPASLQKLVDASPQENLRPNTLPFVVQSQLTDHFRAKRRGVRLEPSEISEYADQFTPDEVSNILWFDAKMAIARHYQQFIFELAVIVADHLGHVHVWEESGDFAPSLLARLYFVYPKIRHYFLNDLLNSDEVDEVIPEWRGITVDLQRSSLAVRLNWHDSCPVGLRRVLDWQPWHDYFQYYYQFVPDLLDHKSVSLQRWAWVRENLTEIIALGAIEKVRWRRRMQRKGTTFFLFLRHFSMFVGRVVVNHNRFANAWQFLPGYLILIKAFIVAMKRLRVEYYPDELVNAAGSLLRNHRLLAPFIKAMMGKTNVYNPRAVFFCLDNASFWLKSMARFDVAMTVDFDWPFMNMALRIILESDHSKNVSNALAFIYRIFYSINGPYSYSLLGDMLINNMFYTLWFHWSFPVRYRYMQLLLFRYCEAASVDDPQYPFPTCFQRIISFFDSINLGHPLCPAAYDAIRQIRTQGRPTPSQDPNSLVCSIFRSRNLPGSSDSQDHQPFKLSEAPVMRDIHVKPLTEETHKLYKHRRAYFTNSENDYKSVYKEYLLWKSLDFEEQERSFPDISLTSGGKEVDSVVEDFQVMEYENMCLED